MAINGHDVREGVPLLKPRPVAPVDTPTDVPQDAPEVPGQRQETRPAARVRARRSRRALRALRTAATHDRTRGAGRAVVRHGAYIAGGAGIVVKRAWRSRTVAEHQQMIRSAIAAGDHATAAEWQDKADRFRQARHARRMDLLTKAPHMVRSAAFGAAGLEGGLLVLGVAMAIADHRIGDVFAPTAWALDVIRTALVIVHMVWGPVMTAAPFAALAGLWAVGAKRGAAPTWAMPERDRTVDDVPITPSIVVKALSDLGIPALRKAIKDMSDGAAGMLGPIRLAGCGVEVDVTLPSGVSTEEILGRRRKLAENLHRHEHELHMSIPQAARTVRMWIADSGALDEPIGPSPLVLDPDVTADMRKGRAPWGVDLRGDQVAISLWQRHMLITGLSNQGKTASLRALALWLALDPAVEFRIADLKGVGDWSMFAGLATVLIEGPTDEHVVAATHMAEEGVAEMGRRIDLMRQLRAQGWAQDKILSDSRFRPLVLVFDEAQVAYGSGAVGEDKRPYGGSKATSRYFRAIKAIHDQGRAVNVTSWEGTQDPTNENLPKRSREGNHIRGSLVLGTETQARMALGDQAIDGGAAPHKLRQGLDKGTLVLAGDGVKLAPGQASVTVRTHFVDLDEAAELVERAKARRAGVKSRTDVPEEKPDHLANVSAVLQGCERIQTQEVIRRLIDRWPSVYQGWELRDLKRELEEAGAAPYQTRADDGSSGVMCVSRIRVLAALERRDETAEDDGE